MPTLGIRELGHCPTGLFSDQVEGDRLLAAFDQCGLAGFKLGYLQVVEQCIGGDHIAATLPYFVTIYRLDTMVTQPALKWLLRPFRFRMASAGHPSIDIGRMDGKITAPVLDVINRHLAKKAKLVVYKMFDCALPLTGFTQAQGLPVHRLDLAYFTQSMRNNRRKNIRKRFEKSATLRFEFVDNGATLSECTMDRLYELYLQTEHKASHAFASLSRLYFTATASLSQYQLAFEGDLVIGFIQVISLHSHSAAKYIGMDYARSQQYGLYFSLILHSIEALQKNGCHMLDLGVGTAYFKQLLGCESQATHLYFRHEWPWLNALLTKCKFLLEPTQAELG